MTELIVRTKQDVQEALKLLKSQWYVTFDIETNSLAVRTGKIIGFGCSSHTFAFYVIMKSWNGTELVDNLSDADVLPIIEALKSKRLITWNGSFDIRFTYHYFGVALWDNIYADGMLAAHTCNENLPVYGLKAIAKMLYGDSAGDEQQDLFDSIKQNGGSEKEYFRADSEIMAKYGLQDNLLTFKIWQHYDKLLKRDGLSKFFYTDEVMPLYKEVTIPMELKGTPINVPFVQQSLEEIKIDLAALEDKIQAQIAPLLYDFNQWYLNSKFPFKLSGPSRQKLVEHFTVPNWPKTETGAYSFSKTDVEKLQKKGLLEKNTQLERHVFALDKVPEELEQRIQLQLLADSGVKYPFNLLSKDHLKRLFFTKLREDALSHTDLGNPQIDDDFLDVMAQKYEWAQDLRTFNKLTKIKGTYIERFLEKQEGGIFYPSFFQHRTVSGRYGSDLQQLPRPIAAGDAEPVVIKYANRIRQFFVAGAGYKFIDDDFESLEPHVFAHVSGEQKLKDIFLKGWDFYSTIAIDTEGIEGMSADKSASNYLGKLNKKKRQDSKAYALGVPYGMSGYLLGITLGISSDRGDALVKKYLQAYPDLKSWMDSSTEFAIKHGYMRIESGRIRRMPELPYLIGKYGRCLLNPLEVWERYGDLPKADYIKMKNIGRKARNYINNARNIQIQGLSSSIVNRACIALARSFKAEKLDAYICAQIHDEVISRASDAHTQRVSELTQLAFENTYKISIPLKAVPSIGDNFADAKG